jgi:hypothetical protein
MLSCLQRKMRKYPAWEAFRNGIVHPGLCIKYERNFRYTMPEFFFKIIQILNERIHCNFQPSCLKSSFNSTREISIVVSRASGSLIIALCQRNATLNSSRCFLLSLHHHPSTNTLPRPVPFITSLCPHCHRHHHTQWLLKSHPPSRYALPLDTASLCSH